MCRSCSIYCIVPPVVFEQIAKNGSREQREWAVETVSRDHSLRAARIQNSLLRGSGPIRADALAGTDPGQPKRTVYDAKNQEQVTGEVVRAEGGPAVGDDAADEAFDGLGATYTMWYDVYQRDSIDDAGLPLDAVVHYGDRYDNAFWDGQRMVFGDGDGEMFNRFTVALDVIGHELAHGVVETTANLNYWQQPGALNEHVVVERGPRSRHRAQCGGPAVGPFHLVREQPGADQPVRLLRALPCLVLPDERSEDIADRLRQSTGFAAEREVRL